MNLNESIIELAKTYLQRQERLEELSKRLRFNLGKVHYSDTLEDDLVKDIEKIKIEGKVAAVDGGIIVEEMHGLDIVVCRSIAAKFEYRENELVAHDYYPKSRPELELEARSALENFERIRFSSLVRLKSEIKCAIGALNAWELDYLLMDGSIAPLVADKPPEDSELKPIYDEVIELYLKLYKRADEKGVNLVGVTKDSRGKRFIDMISSSAEESKEDLSQSVDTVFLDYLLNKNERTFVFKYSKQPSRNQILKDLGEWASKILTVYLKPVEGDRPIRIEFLAKEDRGFDEICNYMGTLCSLHEYYAYPAVLIEVDLRAAMEPIEIERVVEDLNSKIGRKRGIMPLRRNSRPFR